MAGKCIGRSGRPRRARAASRRLVHAANARGWLRELLDQARAVGAHVVPAFSSLRPTGELGPVPPTATALDTARADVEADGDASADAEQHFDEELIEPLVRVPAHREFVEPLGLRLQGLGAVARADRRLGEPGVPAAASASDASGSASNRRAASASAR